MNPFLPNDPRYILWEQAQQTELPLQTVLIEEEEEEINGAILYYVPEKERN